MSEATDRMAKALAGKERGKGQHVVVRAGDLAEVCRVPAGHSARAFDLRNGAASVPPDMAVTVNADHLWEVLDTPLADAKAEEGGKAGEGKPAAETKADG